MRDPRGPPGHRGRRRAACGAVAEINTKPETPFTHTRRFCELDQIAVASEHRRKGVGTALVDAVVHHGRSEGVTEILLGTRPWNVEAQELFRRHGFAVQSLRLGRSV